MEPIRIALVGVGNCASALLQGIQYYRGRQPRDAIGLMHWEIGVYRPSDIEAVAAFDIDERKVGHDIHAAIFAPPNCTEIFCPYISSAGVKVSMGAVIDGFSEHTKSYEENRRIKIADRPEATAGDVVKILRNSGAEILINYLPVGSEVATKFYAECALEAGVAFINNIPVFIASDPKWAVRFENKRIPILGDDIKSQLGATITHRALTDLFCKRGVKLERTYQLNTGGNTDFLNMLNRDRLQSKRTSKTEAVQSTLKSRLEKENIHIGPSDYVPWQLDNKVCFIRMEGRLFGNIPMNLELRLSVEDSPNSAGVVIDAVRCCKLALLNRIGGAILGPSAFFFKHPPKQFSDDFAYRLTEDFIAEAMLKQYHPSFRKKGEIPVMVHVEAVSSV